MNIVGCNVLSSNMTFVLTLDSVHWKWLQKKTKPEDKTFDTVRLFALLIFAVMLGGSWINRP